MKCIVLTLFLLLLVLNVSICTGYVILIYEVSYEAERKEEETTKAANPPATGYAAINTWCQKPYAEDANGNCVKRFGETGKQSDGVSVATAWFVNGMLVK